MALYLIADAMLVIACGILHVTMMRRYHSRPDLKFRATLLALAAAFGVCGGVFIVDAWQVWSGDGFGGPWPRLVAGVVSLTAAIVVARPQTQAYYMSISTPESVEHHKVEIEGLLKRIAERERNAGNAT